MKTYRYIAFCIEVERPGYKERAKYQSNRSKITFICIIKSEIIDYQRI